MAVTLGGDMCPVCGERAQRAIDAGGFSLFACRHCESWSSDALHRKTPSTFEHKRYHENDHADDDKREALLERLARAGSPLGSVLDVGCGTGAFLSYMQRRDPELRCVGIELDEDRAALARRANPRARILTGDALARLAEVDERFDLVTLWDVFEHVPEPGPLLTDLAERLTPAGCIYIQTINEHSIVPLIGRLSYRMSGGRLRGPVRRTHDPDHLVFFSRRGLDLLSHRSKLAVRERWFDRLARARMDGSWAVRSATSMLLATENALGNGLFVNLILERPAAAANS